MSMSKDGNTPRSGKPIQEIDSNKGAIPEEVRAQAKAVVAETARKSFGHHNSKPLRDLITRSEAGNSSGKSLSKSLIVYTKGPTEEEKKSLMKTPNPDTMHSSLLCRCGIPVDGEPLTEAQLRDQALLVKISLVSDALCAAFFGKNNVAETRHLYGSLDGEQQPQHYMDSHIERDSSGKKLVPDLDEMSDAKVKRDSKNQRHELTQYDGKDITADLQVGENGPRLVGMGMMVGCSHLTHLKDNQSKNLAFRYNEKAKQYDFYKFDNKVALGAIGPEVELKGGVTNINGINRLSPFFEEKEQSTLRSEMIANRTNEVDYCNGIIGGIAEQRNEIEPDFKADIAAVLAQKSQGGPKEDGLVKWEVEIEGGTIFALTVSQVHPNLTLDDLHQIYQQKIQVNQTEIFHLENQNNPLRSLLQDGNMQTLMDNYFPTQERMIPSLNSPENVFAIPFSKHFAQNEGLTKEVMTSLYVASHLDPKTISKTVHGIMGPEFSEEADRISGQLVINSRTMKATLEQYMEKNRSPEQEKCSEYEAFTANNRDFLHSKLGQAHEDMLVKTQDFQIASSKGIEKTPLLEGQGSWTKQILDAKGQQAAKGTDVIKK